MGGASFRRSRYEVIDLDVRRDRIRRGRLFTMETVLPYGFQVGVGGGRCHADAIMHRSSTSTRSDKAAGGEFNHGSDGDLREMPWDRLASAERRLVFLSLDDKAEELRDMAPQWIVLEIT